VFWDQLLDFFLSGLQLGAIFAFIALGYTMVYGIIRLINFAHGEFMMFGAYAGYFCLQGLGLEKLALPFPLPILLNFFVALSAAALAAGILAVVTERIAYRPVRRAGRISALITAVCVSFILQNLAVKAFDAEALAYPQPREFVAVEDLEATLPFDYAVETPATPEGRAEAERWDAVLRQGAPMDAGTREQLAAAGHAKVYRTVTLSDGVRRGFILLALALWTPVLWLLVMRTRTGKAMRAVSEDHDAARLMGIPLDRIVASTFFMGAFVAGVGGVAWCVVARKVEPLTGFLPGLKAFVAAVIGGIGSIPGAIVGGLVLGVAELVLPFLLQEALAWEGAFAWKDAIAFALLILILVVKPTGLLGAPQRVKV
jgi:branched-chain amino acid transport system permease protein